MSLQSFKIAIFGQGAFSASFLERLVQQGHTVCGVFTILDNPKTGRPDALALAAQELNLPVFKIKRWRVPPETQAAIPEEWAKYEPLGADLNVLPFCNQFIPMQVIEAPRFKSINYHPSLLPLHRGASSINWTLTQGDRQAGFTIFWTDDGLDTGDILLKRACFVRPNDTVDSLYSRFLYPEGVNGLLEAVELIKAGQASRFPQPKDAGPCEPMLRNLSDHTEIQFNKLQNHLELHNFIRGMDKVPGAWCRIRTSPKHDYERVKMFGSSRYEREIKRYGKPETIRSVQVYGLELEAIVHSGGLLLYMPDGKPVNVGKLQLVDQNNKMIQASSYGSPEANSPPLELSQDELDFEEKLRKTWAAILGGLAIQSDTDFFFAGAQSMDVVRLVETTKDLTNSESFQLEDDDIYLASQFSDFVQLCVRRLRGESSVSSAGPLYEPVELKANNLDLSFPSQLFINNQFVDASSGQQLNSVNPHSEEIICCVQSASKQDVDRAVLAARRAFDPRSPWRTMDASKRGLLMNRLAALMEEHKQELATLESLDSGAVYTLALKTHVGMSIDVFRYFAGWCDKIQGDTIPIKKAHPNRFASFTNPIPIGVCGLITPWNYPLMMVAWKAAACLAAGNTLVLKPASDCPLTALKWAELSVKAGFPPGVINVLPGKGSVCGQAILDHPGISKVGFTGSTETGKQIMHSCASTLKKCSLELGGKSPLIIFADCDMSKAVKCAMSSVFFNKGENCIAAGRIFIEQSIHDRFLQLVKAQTARMVIGDPLDRSTDHGPQNHLAHLLQLEEYCRRGIQEGARLVCGGKRLPRTGYYFQPTIFTDVEDDMYIAREESFGPIMIISSFPNDDVEGVIDRANDNIYGLAAGVMTSDFSKAMLVADNIEAGTCFINTYNKTDAAAPFGGFKQSGFGKDLGQAALKEYLKERTVTYEF